MNFQSAEIDVSKWIEAVHFEQKFVEVGFRKSSQLGAVILTRALWSINLKETHSWILLDILQLQCSSIYLAKSTQAAFVPVSLIHFSSNVLLKLLT